MGDMTELSTLSPTARTTVGRMRERARTDRAELYALLDEGLICHLGVPTGDAPMVLPTCYGRIGDTLYVHGSSGARSLLTGRGGPVCVTVTLVDGLVYARSVMHFSANYRCAVVYGTARPVTDPDEKLRALEAVVEHTTPGSWDHARRPNRKELAATSVLAVPLAEASVKVRVGPPGDDDEDVVANLAWAGVLPLRTEFGEPRPCPLLAEGTPVPEHVAKRAR
jgi:uncharacterized protein